jgi:hypothetical protein
MSELTPCPACQRHLRKTEMRCPFCGEAVSLAHVPAPALPRKRLGRAATFAFGASVVGGTLLVACGDDDSGGIVPVYGAPSGGSSFAGSAVYGAPPSGSSTGGNSNADAGAGTAVYGAPAAGSGNDEPGGNGGAGGAPEGGNSNDGGAAIYGGPPSGAGGV